MEINTNTITLAILHGSRAVYEAHENSDWDVAVLGDHALRADERSRLRRAYAAQFNVPEEKIDIADLRADSPLRSPSMMPTHSNPKIARNVSGSFSESEESHAQRGDLRAG